MLGAIAFNERRYNLIQHIPRALLEVVLVVFVVLLNPVDTAFRNIYRRPLRDPWLVRIGSDALSTHGDFTCQQFDKFEIL